MSINLNLTIDRPCATEQGEIIPVGTTVEYRGHLSGGAIRVLWGERECVIHPCATKELRG